MWRSFGSRRQQATVVLSAVEAQGPSTTLAISHIRCATRWAVALSNTQPFARELAGRMHVFAHNGDLPGIERTGTLAFDRYRPVGTTNSEHAFCALPQQNVIVTRSPCDA